MDVIRRTGKGIMDPEMHPALRLIGLVAEEVNPAGLMDPAREHDALVADAEEESWSEFGTPTSDRRPE